MDSWTESRCPQARRVEDRSHERRATKSCGPSALCAPRGVFVCVSERVSDSGCVCCCSHCVLEQVRVFVPAGGCPQARPWEEWCRVGDPGGVRGCTARLHGLTQALAPFTHTWKLRGLSHPRHELFI